MTWTDDHGEDGLRRKFDVYKPRAGTPLGVQNFRGLPGMATAYPNDTRVGADGEFIFVLRPESDEAAYDALLRYAHVVEHTAPQLADDIHAALHRIRVANERITP